MGAWQKTMDPQKPENYPWPGSNVVERQSPKSKRQKKSVAGQCRTRQEVSAGAAQRILDSANSKEMRA